MAEWTKGSGVVLAGEGNVKIFTQKISAYAKGTKFTITSADLVGELSDISGFGASRETKEINGYHYDSAVKKVMNSTPNDISFTENLVTSNLSTLRKHYNDKDLLLSVVVEYESATPTVLYACVGKIMEWGMELPVGDTTTLTYTMAIEEDSVPEGDITLPE